MNKFYFMILFCSFSSFSQTSRHASIETMKIIEKEEIKNRNVIKQKKNDSLKIIEYKLIKKFGAPIYAKLKAGKYWIGMTKEMTLISLGRPNNINRTVTKFSVSEQWVYSGLYIYFENGKVTSFQD